MPVTMTSSTEYHDAVAYARHTMTGRMLDWTNQPSVYKIYRHVPQRPLSWPKQLPHTGYFDCLHQAQRKQPFNRALDEETLAVLLASSGGISEVRPAQGGEIHLRVAPSAGALYPCELYIAVRNVAGIEPGLYHYFVAQHTLSKLRSGVFTAQAMGIEGRAENAAALVFVSTIFFRSAWKYDKRSYRYLNLDSGHVIEAMGAAADGLHVGCTQDWVFDDDAVHRFLGVDRTREACLAIMHLNAKTAHQEREESSVTVESSLSGLSKAAPQDDTPEAVWAIHALTSATGAVRKELAEPKVSGDASSDTNWRALDILDERQVDEKPLFETVMLRRSKRNFITETVRRETFSLLASCFAQPLSMANEEFVTSHIGIAMALQSIEGWQNGIYWLDTNRTHARQAAHGSFGPDIAKASLEQMWLSNAALLVGFFLRSGEIDRHLGPRGYRACMMACAEFGHRLYLGATSLGLGACGIGAFYDEEVARFYHAQSGERPAYIVAVGPIKK
ncbi:SagB family peptide dehydrogenase [Desulfovibrio inopinatus]|uniref:SagB family peptide dehydrogenase n=1 Tax=Desulfovibrio inopinatus TaxID=102109 RepID=UPI00042A2F8B|nr:SagB family peptide dehydrogenase [Desulfovibrio inopinatus]